VAALPPGACIAPSRPSPFGAGPWSRISARLRATAHCNASQRCLIRRLDLGLGEEDGDADVHPPRRQIRSRRRRPWSVAVSDSVVEAATATPPSSRTVRPQGCPALPTRVHPFQGRHPSPCPRPRRRSHDQGTNGPRAPTPGTGVAPPPPQRGRPWRLLRPKHASLRAVLTPPGRGAGLQSAPAQDGRLAATRAGGAYSVGSILGRGNRTATQMSARSAAECDRVEDALGRSLSTTQSSMPPTRRHRRRLRGSRRLVVVIAAASLVSCARPIICFLFLPCCAILVESYLARSLSQLSSAVCRSTSRGAGCSPRCSTGRHHRGGLPRAKPHPQFWRRRWKTPMVTTPPVILVFIRLTLLRRRPRRGFLGERSNAEHRRRPGRQSGTVS